MNESLTSRCANAVTGLALSLLLVCGVLVVSDVGTYLLPGPGPQARAIPSELPDSNGGIPGARGATAGTTEPRSATPRRRAVPNDQGVASARSAAPVRPVSYSATDDRARPGRATTGPEVRARGSERRTNSTAPAPKQRAGADAEGRSFSETDGGKPLRKRS